MEGHASAPGDSSFTLLDGVDTKEEQEGDEGLYLDVIQPDSLWQDGKDG